MNVIPFIYMYFPNKNHRNQVETLYLISFADTFRFLFHVLFTSDICDEEFYVSRRIHFSAARSGGASYFSG